MATLEIAYLLSMFLLSVLNNTVEHFGSHPMNGANNGISLVDSGIQLPGDAEVDELKAALLVDHYVPS
jgi:hypothetical protein